MARAVGAAEVGPHVTASYRDLKGRNYLHVLVEENARFLDAARDAGMTSAVEACPGWSVADLVFHMSRVQNMFHGMLTTDAETPKDLPRLEKPAADDDALKQFADGAARLESLLANTPDDKEVWTFTGPRPALWVKRRQAQEVLVHRLDAEMAGRNVTTADEVACADGIDELFGVFVPRLGEKVQLTGSVHLHCTDTDGEWMLVPGESGVSVAREHGKGDVAFRGSAQLLLLTVWRRISVDEAVVAGAQVFGDRAVLDGLISSLAI